MRKGTNLSRATGISAMLVASTVHFVLAASTMVARDAAVLKAVSQAWKLHWNQTDPCSTPWLSCDKVGNAISLNLTNKSLMGSIPEILGNLTSLETLDLSSNYFTGSIPESLGNLTNLQYMDLDSNYLNGSIPESLGNLTNLQYLLLGSSSSKDFWGMNYLTGGIPESLGDLKKLVEMDLSRNQLAGSIPDSLGKLTNLLTLSLSSTKPISIPESLGNLSKLKYLSLSSTKPMSIPESLGNLSKLKYLSLSVNYPMGIPESLENLSNLKNLSLIVNKPMGIPESLGHLSNLKYLYLSNYELTGSIPWSLGDLINLQILLLDNNELTGTIPVSLGNLTNLQDLHLNNNGLTGTIPGSLGNLSNLQTLWLSANKLTGRIPESLGDLKNLEWLDLEHNELTGSIPRSLGKLNNLSYCWMDDNKLTGRIPESLADIEKLSHLHLRNNKLTGPIPDTLGDLKYFTVLGLSENKLTGSIPESLGKLTNFSALDLRNNELTGTIPESLQNLTSLLNLDLSNNKLTGSIPESLGNLTDLWTLSLDNNELTGSIPESLGKLANVYMMNLSGNELTGSIPESLGNITTLNQLDLSKNRLTGRIPDYLGNLTYLSWLLLQDNFFTSIAPAVVYYRPVKADGRVDFSGNCIPNSVGQRSDADCQSQAATSPAPTFSAPTPLNQKTPTPSPSPMTSAPAPAPAPSGEVPGTSSVRWWIWLAVAIIAAFIFLATVAAAFCLAKRSSKQDQALELGNAGFSTLNTYTLAQIRSMTGNWGQENLLGSGGFGSVYKGVMEGHIVAVKKLKMEGVDDDNKAVKEFLNEVAILSKVRHRNLVALKGFCCNRGKRILVMEFVSNGNLADHLFYHQEKGLPVLEWSTRCKIATTAAEALHYLHSLNDEKIIHRDIKAENILLDESYNSLVCDFGLAKLMPQLVTGSMPTVATRNVAGTKGYMAPEWLIQGILSDKMDVYSFGIVLLELVTGATRFKCYTLGEGPDALYSVHEAAWIVCTTRQDALSLLLDSDITETVPPESAMSILRLALHCINEERRDRPTMERVVRMLKGMIEVPPLPTELPSWFQEVDTSIDLTNGSILEDQDIGDATLQEICIHEDRDSTHENP